MDQPDLCALTLALTELHKQSILLDFSFGSHLIASDHAERAPLAALVLCSARIGHAAYAEDAWSADWEINMDPGVSNYFVFFIMAFLIHQWSVSFFRCVGAICRNLTIANAVGWAAATSAVQSVQADSHTRTAA